MENLLERQLETLSLRTDKLEQNYHSLDKTMAVAAQNQSRTLEILEDVQDRLKTLEFEKNKREGLKYVFQSVIDKFPMILILIIIFAVLGLNDFVHNSSHLFLKHLMGG